MSDPAHILNWRRIDARLTTSGQPQQHELRDIATLGVTQVINLGLHSHAKALRDEATLVAALGMRYVHLPVDFDSPTEDDYLRFVDAMAGAAGAAVHVHCIMNMRVTAFVYRWRRDVLGIDDAQARAAMDSIWAPGGRWAVLIGDEAASGRPHGPPPRTAPYLPNVR